MIYLSSRPFSILPRFKSNKHDVEELRVYACSWLKRYAIAGQPVTHSLSPLLFGLVVANLEKFKGRVNLKFASSSLHLIETKTIEDALGWSYSEATPRVCNWEYTGVPFGKYRTETLVSKAIAHAVEVEDCDAMLVSDFDSMIETTSGAYNLYLEQAVKQNLPTNVLENEVFLNLTSPLKHQLSSDAVSAVDESMKIQSVNSLRWDGRSWWCAGVDGLGIVSLANNFGIFAEKGAVLGLEVALHDLQPTLGLMLAAEFVHTSAKA